MTGPRVWYNDNDPRVCGALERIMNAGLIPEGHIDGRSVWAVRPEDVAGYDQCHFFAGVGGWAYAASIAPWPAGRPLWTGSCPCQSVSIAGPRRGHADERHLWPAFYRLIAECRPASVTGEQVADGDGREWYAGVRADLEATGYACGAANLCAAGTGAPHPRQRIFWLAKRLGDASSLGRGEKQPEQPGRQRLVAPPRSDGTGGMGHAMREGREIGTPAGEVLGFAAGRTPSGAAQRSDDLDRPSYDQTTDVWCDWDQKIRRAPPCLSMLAHGVPSRVLAFHLFGNAIHAELAATWLRVIGPLLNE